MSGSDLDWAFRADGRNRRSKPGVLPLTSMMDMLTIILIFLLLNLAPDYAVSKVSEDLDLPKAAQAEEAIGAHRISISRTTLELDDRPIAPVIGGKISDVDLVLFRDTLARAFDPADPEAKPVVLLADETLPYETVDRVVRAAGEAGFPDFNFAIVNQEG